MLNAFLRATSLVFAAACGAATVSAETVQIDAAAMRNLVERSYQYVAMFNVNNKMALDEDEPASTKGYNRVIANTRLLDHTDTFIARPNNDTLYVIAMVDVTEQPMVLILPAFDSVYVSLMITSYDHYVTIPLSTGQGNFGEPTTLMLYSDRTPGYKGAPVEGVDRVIETTGDFLSAVLRVMPHAAEPLRREVNLAAMRDVELVPLSEFQGAADDAEDFVPWDSPSGVSRRLDLKEDIARFPPFGSDFEIFEDRFLEVMQFVVNHTTLDSADKLDAELLKALEPLGVAPGQKYDPAAVAQIDGSRLRATAQEIAKSALSKAIDPDWSGANATKVFQSKGNMDLDALVVQSVLGPIGQPASEALYPYVRTPDGAPMNAMFDYEIVMSPEAMPPAKAFWSLTIYDSENGFFIPNESYKYSVGENAGFQLDEDGGIRIVVSTEQPEGLPLENWLPINRGDYGLDVTLRIYSPDLERFGKWSAPVARRID